eukprot:COSAG02_NODE_4653_length_5132_cov_2.022651_2_plen_133_part_00
MTHAHPPSTKKCRRCTVDTVCINPSVYTDCTLLPLLEAVGRTASEEMAQQIDLSGDGGVLKQVLAEGAGPQVGAIARCDACVCVCVCVCARMCRTRENRECALIGGAWCGCCVAGRARPDGVRALHWQAAER